MRPEFVLLLVTVTFLASASPTIAKFSPMTSEESDEVFFNKFLRAEKNEERAGAGLASTIAKAKPLFAKSSMADDVLLKLKSDSQAEKFLTSPKFIAWFHSLDDFNKKNPEQAAPAISKLTKVYDDPVELTLILMKGERNWNSEVRTIASTLQAQQMASWKSAGLTHVQVFDILKLGDDVENLFSNQLVHIWSRFVRESDGRTKVFQFLINRIGEEGLGKAVAMRPDPSLEKMSGSLGVLLLKKWKRDNKDVDEVAKIVGTAPLGKMIVNVYRGSLE